MATTPAFPEPSSTSGFSPKKFFKNRKVILTLSLILLLVAYGAWAQSGFNLEFFRFFASEGVDTDTPNADSVPQAGDSPECDKANIVKVDGPNANGTARVKNNNGVSCIISLASYEIWSDRGGTHPHYIEQQTLFNSDVRTVTPGETQSFSVSVPSCYSQIDLVIGEPIEPPTYHPSVFLGVAFQNWGDPDGTQHYCEEPQQTPPPTPAPLACLPPTQSFSAGGIGNFGAQGGTAPYTWAAPGGAPTSGSGTSFSSQYAAAGAYTVTLKDSANRTATCAVTVTAGVCPATAPANALATKVSETSATLTWTPGTGGTYQQLRVGANQAEVNSGCQAIPTTCVVVEHNLPLSTAMYLIKDKLTPGTVYYWRVVNLHEGPPVCYKDVAAQFTTPSSPVCPIQAPTSLKSVVSGTTATLTWTPGSSADPNDVNNRQMLRVGTDRQDVLEGCPSTRGDTCIVKEDNLPFNQTSYTVNGITPGLTYYWRVVNFQSASCYKDAEAAFKTEQTSPVVCSPKTQNRNPGEVGVISASGGSGQYVWSASGGTPATGTGSTFGTAFQAAGSHDVELRDAAADRNAPPAVCKIFVVTPPVGFQCSPATQTAYVEQTVNLSAVGGSGTYTWAAPGAVITTGTGTGFSTRYSVAGTHTVTVTSGTENRTCEVIIQTPPTPIPTPPPTPGLTITKLVRNTSTNSAEVDVVSASPNDTVEFSIRVTAYNAVVRNARLVDVLPAGLTYVTGSTTVDGVVVADGPTNASGIFLGDMVAGRTILVRFRATVAGPNTFSVGTTTLTNMATATGDNVPPASDPAFVNVMRAPTNPIFALQKFGRNLTRGEFAEQDKVTAYPNNTIEFIIHIRSLSSTQQDNVILRDVLPAYITYIPQTTSIDGILAGDGLTSGGLNIGSFAPGQEKVVRFSGKVASAAALPVGTTSVINTAQLDQPPLIAQLPVIIINGIVAGAGQVPTGAEDSVLAALLVSLLITLMYVAYTRTQLFKTRELKSLITKHRGSEDDFDFKK